MRGPAWGAGACGSLLLLLVFVAALLPGIPGSVGERGMPFMPPSKDHPLGTDDAGGDVWTQLLLGARNSLLIGMASATGTIAMGTVVALGGVHGGQLAGFVWRLVDLWAALPRVAVLLFLAALLRPDTSNVILALALLNWPLPARVLKPRMEHLVQHDLYRGYRVLGGSVPGFWMHHGLPSLFPLIASLFVLEARIAVLAEAGLAFLGLRDPSAPTWGGMIARALDHHFTWVGGAWKWVVVPPAAGIVAVTLGLALISWALEPFAQPQVARWMAGQAVAATVAARPRWASPPAGR